MLVERVWAMPSCETFAIKPVAELINAYVVDGIGWVDPFARNSTMAEYTNDIDQDTTTTHHMDAIDFLMTFPAGEMAGVLIDPPYSMRQVLEMYRGNRVKKITPVLDVSAEIVRTGGYAISCGWNSNGLGKKRGFEIIQVLVIAHGGQHNDTIVTVETKVI